MSGNPGGRPKGIVARVKVLGGDDARQYLKILHDIATGALVAKAHSLATGEEYEVGPSYRDRIEAAKELLSRGFGKPASPVELTGADGAPLKVVFRIEEGE